MRVLRRGLRNLGRNRPRALLVILLLGVSVGTFLIMAHVSAQTRAEARLLREEAYTLIQVNPVGQSGIVGSRPGLPEDLAVTIAALPRVKSVEAYLRRQFQDNTKPRQFQMGVVIGVQPEATLRLTSMGSFVSSPALAAGRMLTRDDHGPVAVVGRVFAHEKGLQLGSEFTIPAQLLQGRGGGQIAGAVRDLRVRIVGIFTTGVTWGDNQVFVPLDVLQRALGREGEVSQFWVKVDRAEDVPRIGEALKTALAGQVDILTFERQARLVAQSLETVQTNSVVGAGLALVVGALITLLSMALVTRERTREIGVLKAIGASNRDVAAQFLVESVALAVLGGTAGVALFGLAGSPVTLLIAGQSGSGVVRPPVVLETLLYALLLCMIFAIAGSLYPVRQAIRMRPVDAIRHQ